MARVVFLGTPEYALPALERMHGLHEVVAVITQPDQPAGRGRRVMAMPPVKTWALSHGLPLYQPRSLRRDHELVGTLRALAPDVLVLAAYGQILREAMLNLAPYGCIGLHASLLPRWRGAAPVAAAILHGDTMTGVSLMLTDAGMDTGPIIAQRSIQIGRDDTTPLLTQKLAVLAADTLEDVLPDWLKGKITPRVQDEGQATYAPLLTREQGLLDWRLPAVNLERAVRALNPWPGTYTLLDGCELKVHSARAIPGEDVPDAPGTVVNLGGRIGVVTGKGVLVVDILQLEGRRSLPAPEFARGRRGFVGARLGQSDG